MDDTRTGPGPPTARGLAFRMGLALCLASAAILAVAGTLNLRLQRRALTRLLGSSADRIAETIRRSSRDAMLRNDREDLHRLIGLLGAQEGISRIRVFNKEGRIQTSTLPEEVGRLVDKRAEQCDACHQGPTPLARLEGPDRVRIFHANGARVLGVIAPIHNEPQCQGACHAHPASQQVLGVLDVQMSMASADQALRTSERQMLAGLAASVAASLAAAGFLVWRLVLSPVRRLTRAMARVAGGEPAVPVPVTSSDEIGRMSEAWNAMTGQLARARQEIEAWNRTLEDRVRAKSAELERAYEGMRRVDKLASLGKLAAVVAHEINNPLAGIRTYARLMLRRISGPDGAPASDAEAARILGLIDAESGRCGEIVRHLLLFGRASPARFAEAGLPAILDRCRALLRHRAEMGGVELQVEAEAGLPPLECDAGQVEQMLLALGLNGVEATPAGGRVSILARRDGEELLVQVRDTGAGIPARIRDRIFEPFVTTKEEGKGVGLGLAVVYGIVQRHHGRIEVESHEGSGTEFSVHVPFRRPAPEEAREET